MKAVISLAATMVLLVAFVFAPTVVAQQPAPVQPTEEELKAKAELEQKALSLLEQVISESQSLKLPESRIRVLINAGTLLWERDQTRARSLYSNAGSLIVDMMRSFDPGDRQYFNLLRVPLQLRQDLVLSVARQDSTLAYQILHMTKPAPATASAQARGPGQPQQADMEANLERNLLAQIAATDPKVALQNAEELLAKNQYSSAMANVLAQLQLKDKEAAATFQEKLTKKLQSENLLANPGASGLAMALLRPGVKVPVDPSNATAQPTNQGQVAILTLSAYRDLLETVIAASLKAQPPAQNQGRGAGGNDRPGPPGPRGPGGPQAPPQQTSAQIEQNSARNLLGGLQNLLSQIDLYLPARSLAVRQKLTSMGMDSGERRAIAQLTTAVQQGSSAALLAAAATAPQQAQPRLYQQAAMKALEEGNSDQARQIANNHLEPGLRASVLQSIELQVLARTAGAEKIEEIRVSLSRLRNDDERIRQLIQLASSAAKQNPKLSVALLDEARSLVSRRPANYEQFDSQLRVARVFAASDAARVVEILEPGILQLNELLQAAAVLSGFELDVFKDGELPLQGGSRLSNTVTRYAQQLSSLARTDFEAALTGADKFQIAEARIIAKLAISRSALGKEGTVSSESGFSGRPFPPEFAPPDRRQP